jgi:oxygen-dependent protoporphyrinogen oxidase
MQHILIIGGGISGLATAFYLQRLAPHARCTVLEGDERLGGKVLTERVDGFIIEGGPESFVTRKPWALALCRELGLGDRLLGADDAGRNYVLHGGRPALAPTTPHGFVTTPLLSLKGKLRAAQELLIPSATSNGDESLGHLVRRRFGDEVADTLVAPAVGSIYLSDVDHLSAQVSFDRFLKLEHSYGSLLKGMLAMQRAARRTSRGLATPTPKPPPFVTLPNGLSELIEALAGHVRAAGGEIRINARAGRIAKCADSGYAVFTQQGEMFEADAVVLAIPAFAMADLIAPHHAAAAQHLRDVRHASVATTTLVYRKADIPTQFTGFGVVVPESEHSPLLACEVLTNKWPGRANADHVMLRAFVGGHRNEAMVAQTDGQLIEVAQRELARIFGVKGKPAVARVFRWQPGNPQYPVGHLDSLKEVETALASALPNVLLTGAGLRGLGIPDCVRQAQETARQIAALPVLSPERIDQRIEVVA